MAPLCYRLVFTTLPRQLHKKREPFYRLPCHHGPGSGSFLFFVFLVGGCRAEAHVFWLGTSKPQLKHFNQSLGSIRGLGQGQVSWEGGQDFREVKTMRTSCSSCITKKCKQDDRNAGLVLVQYSTVWEVASVSYRAWLFLHNITIYL